ncbi:katanin p80 WD40 repeat-containing subunit B1 isoform X1 [Electrophorus electricus]|uniref:Katanin p80 WD40 repeat-containing subunit B1 n=1 Tax=Electrophorus electricus TaxID=8005 RepID=A0A4W4DT21_ELEEL|nr:katanin p80 WD40 repeat-containing subunit B1 isoform X1 [Electrophorus electricus]XP_026853659.2 katanin p80 WD40 repeat-containing subunit B1 isoform X1 [Electrophorus electricus]XP_035382244.1 katanin p80 WD40 repeat-containing subunit B1 isoform X1 [Electrophorus electricus]
MAQSSATKVAWKLQDMVAHSSNVSSLVLGKSSSRLLATGGEDCRVNIWAVNKPNCIMSLTGHNTPVECVQFSSSEEQVVAGSQSGSLRVWDLEAAKILRTLTGHKANICSLDFHPFGEYLASGSMDTNIKLWDVRRKGCVFRYKGHTQAVRFLAFSPDGKWLASASDDSTIKLWDLTAGKMITEFTSHTSSVSIVQFHPNEYLLASGSADRTIKLWDLEKFEMIGSSVGETGVVRCVLFSPDGSCLYSGSEDTLRVYGWEPDRCFDAVHVAWGKVADLAICNNQMIGVSYSQMNVSLHVVDLSRVKKSGSVIQGLIQDDKPLAVPTPKGTTLRRNYERTNTSCNRQKMKQNPDADRRSPEGERRSPSSEEERDEKESSAEITNPDDYREIFQPRNAISRTPPKTNEPFPAPLEDDTILLKPSPAAEILTPMPDRLKAPTASSTPVLRVEPTVVVAVPRPPNSVVTASLAPPSGHVVPTSKLKPNSAVIPSTRNEPVGLNAGDFLPPAQSGKTSVASDEEALVQIRKGHDTMCVMLTSRHKNLDMVRIVWARNNIKATLDSAVSMNDLSIVVDVLNIINLKPSLWKLDTCSSILPQIEELLQSKYESYVQTGCTSLRLILKRFWPLISDTLTAPPSVGVDITREERHQKCKACYKQLKNLSNVVKLRAEQVGRHGSTFKELQLLMAPLDY